MCVHLRKNDFKNKIGDLISSNIFSLLGRTLRPQNLIEGEYLRWKIENRNIRLRFNLTDKEKELFERKKEESGARSMSHFIRKTVLEKEIYEVDMKPLRGLYGTLSVATNKLNQIAKRVNQTGVIYKSDIDDMKESIEEFSKEQGALHSLLLKRKKY